MRPPFPPSGSFCPRVADMRATPHAARYSVDDLRSRVANEAKHDGAVSVQLQIIDLNAGRRAVSFVIRPPDSRPARRRFHARDIPPDERLHFLACPRLLPDRDANPIVRIDLHYRIGIAALQCIEGSLTGRDNILSGVLRRASRRREQQRYKKQYS